MDIRPPVGPVRFQRHRVPSGQTRSLARLAARDQAAYAELVASARPAIESRLRPGVLANRARRGGRSPEAWFAARATWRRSIQRALARGHPPALLVGDVSDFYRSVRPAAVARALRRAGVDARTAGAVECFLCELGEHGVRGLPVGPEPSATLANVVLAGADDALSRAGFPFLRWVDDVVVFAESPRAAGGAFDLWRRELDRVGLRAHPIKSAVLSDPAEARARLLGRAPSGGGGAGRGIIASA